MAAYRALLATDPVNETARVAISAISLEQGDVKAAEEALTFVAGTSFAGRDVLCAMGDVRRAQGGLAEAAAWYRKAADADPTWVRPVFGLAQVSFAMNDTEGALALMQKVIPLSLTPRKPLKPKCLSNSTRSKTGPAGCWGLSPLSAPTTS